MNDGSRGSGSFCRRAALRALGGTAATAGLAGCLDIGILGEDERDVSLEPANWIVPSGIDEAVASGYADFGSIYSAVGEMDGVTWQAFTEWYGQQTPQPADRSTYPLVPRDVIAGGAPFVVDQEGTSWHYSRDVPAMASFTVRTGDDEPLKHLTVYELPDSDPKSELREYMSNHGRTFKQVESVSITKTLNTYNESEQFTSSTYALEDGVLVNQTGSLSEEPGSVNYGHLIGAVERAGSSVDLGDHPVGQLTGMDMVHTYEFTDEAWTDAVSKSVAIDFGDGTKTELYTFTDQSAATEARNQFAVTDEGALRIESDENTFVWDSTAVEYRTVRTEGRGVRIEAKITALPRAITEGNYIWASRFGVM